MAEVFSGTPSIVNIAISDPEGRKVEYNVCGRDLSVVKDAVRSALEAIPNEADEPKPKKARKKRRTKSEMAAAAETNWPGDTTGIPEGVAPPHRKSKKELVGAGSAWPK